MSLRIEQWQAHSRFGNVPCCPHCSHDQPELLKPVLSFPTWITGKRSGLILLADGCACAEAIPRDVLSVEQCEEDWRQWCRSYFGP